MVSPTACQHHRDGPQLRECRRRVPQSVINSDPVPGGMELIVVDDGSTDDSCQVAMAVVAAAPVPARLVIKNSNTGLADARNVGLEAARGEFVLTLDADNWVYPSCVATLTAALDGDVHAAAYPLLRRFLSPDDEALDLLSTYAWDIARLVRAPYIDALALFRRNVLHAVGGYSTELVDHGWFGWEDYDLWLKLAEAGYTCVQVPNILASYRVHPASMTATTNREAARMARYFRKKFTALAAAHPDLDMVLRPAGRGPGSWAPVGRTR